MPQRSVEPVATRAGAQQRRRALRRRQQRARLVAQATVLALVVAGTTAFATLHKSVLLDVDGTVTAVTTFARTVEDVLVANGVEVGDGDLVAPALGAAVSNGQEIVVRHGREVVVEIDGVEQTVWTTALTVDEIVAELGFRGEVRASAARSEPLGRGLLRLSTTKTLHVAVDGRIETLTSAAPTVRELLREVDVVLGPYDRVSVSLDADAVEGLVVQITRVIGVTRSESVVEPYEVRREDDPTLTEGREVLASRGQDGTKVITYLAYEVDGVEVGRTVLAERVVVPAVDEVTRVGTAAPPTGPVDLGDGVWAALAQCESGGNPRVVSRNGLYYGLFQFALSTWRSVGGTGLPTDASPEEQLERAQILQARSGWGQWPACARKLGLL